jgi:hypothetical protein
MCINYMFRPFLVRPSSDLFLYQEPDFFLYQEGLEDLDVGGRITLRWICGGKYYIVPYVNNTTSWFFLCGLVTDYYIYFIFQ